jgi:hypothetical protein
MKLRQNGTVSFSIKLGAHRPAAWLNSDLVTAEGLSWNRIDIFPKGLTWCHNVIFSLQVLMYGFTRTSSILSFRPEFSDTKLISSSFKSMF